MADTKTAIVTGGTSGLGEATTLALAARGWQVLVVGRDEERGEGVAQRAGNGSKFLKADLFSLDDAGRLAAQAREIAPKLDLLVNNAGGVFSAGPATVDGLERTFALNVAAPFVLTKELREPLQAAQGRVVNIVTALIQGMTVTLDRLVGPKAKGGFLAYPRNKLALLALTQEQQRQWGPAGVTFVALHPGVIPDTRFGHTMTGLNPFTTIGPLFAKLFRFGVSREVAAERYLRVCTGDVEGAGYYYEGKLRRTPKHAADPAFCGALWAKLSQLAPRQGDPV